MKRQMFALLLVPVMIAWAQTTPPADGPSTATAAPQLLSPDQLDNLVAPIALYPDPLLSQVLAASTYPLEIVEAQQWLQQNQNLQGSQRMDAARQQPWDPSVQALVAFPDVLTLLNRDIRWTTDLGNAFLAQQSDVMAAIQRMRVRAQQNGKLTSTPQQTVTTQTQNGQSAVVIQPADPQVIYVPTYNPVYIWGPPAWGYYPPLWYPSISFGFGFGPGIFLGGFFPGWGFGWPGWALGWGWGFGWFGHSVFVNNFFFNHYGFHGFYGSQFGAGGRLAWAHDPFHRSGVPYANRAVASRFNNARFAEGRFNGGSRFTGNSRFNGTGGFNANVRGGSANGWRSFNNPGSSARGFASSNRAFSNPNVSGMNRGYSRSYSTPPNAGRSFSGGQSFNRGFMNSSNRGFSSPAFRGNTGSAPRFSAPSGSFSAPRSGGGGFGGGRSFSGGRSFGGAGHFSGGSHSGAHGGGRR